MHLGLFNHRSAVSIRAIQYTFLLLESPVFVTLPGPCQVLSFLSLQESWFPNTGSLPLDGFGFPIHIHRFHIGLVEEIQWWGTKILVVCSLILFTLKEGMCEHDNLKDNWESQIDAVPRLVASQNMPSSFIEYIIRNNEMTEWHDVSFSYRNLRLAGDQYTNQFP